MTTLTLRPAAYVLAALWRIPAPAGETAELSVAARIFARTRSGPYVGRHRKSNRIGAIRYADVDDEMYAEAIAG